MQHPLPSAIIALICLQALAKAQAHDAKLAKDQEKCAGIVKAGRNDCGTRVHACAGQASADADPREWIALPKGVCRRILGGKVIK